MAPGSPRLWQVGTKGVVRDLAMQVALYERIMAWWVRCRGGVSYG